MEYLYHQKILFRHCDPAGIVFYPRYFEMMNDCVEAFFEEKLGLPFCDLHKTGTVPTAEISTRFSAPSRLGEALCISLCVVKLGHASMGLRFQARCQGESRFETTSTLVLVDNSTGRPCGWPDFIREKINEGQKT